MCKKKKVDKRSQFEVVFFESSATAAAASYEEIQQQWSCKCREAVLLLCVVLFFLRDIFFRFCSTSSQQATTLTLPRPSLHSSNLNLAKKYRSLHERRSYSAEEWKRVQSVAQQSSAVSITLFILHQLLLLSVRHSYSCAGIEERAERRKIIEMKCKFHNLLTQFFRARLTADSQFLSPRALFICVELEA